MSLRTDSNPPNLEDIKFDFGSNLNGLPVRKFCMIKIHNNIVMN